MNMFDFYWNVLLNIELNVIDMMYGMKQNVLFYYQGCKLYDHLLQIRIIQ